MKRVLYVGFFAVSVLMLSGGVLFLCAAISVPARWPLALVLLILGASGAAWSALSYRRWADRQPATLAARITELAARNSGEVSVAQIVASFAVSAEEAEVGLQRLVERGTCYREAQGEQVLFLFPDFKEHKVERRCQSCGSTFAVKEPLHKCPHCGGELELMKT
jgi:hypothetical protein